MIPPSNEERLNADMAAAQSVLDDLIQVGERVCLNASFTASSSENTINDYFRDMLSFKGYSDHVRQYDFPLQIKRPFNVLPYPNAAARVATLILTRDGFDFPVYFIAFKIS